MKLSATHPLKPFDPSPRSAAKAAAVRPPSTRLSPTDLAGVISHPKKDAAPAGADPAAAQHEQIVRKAQQWVGQTFFGTLLKQMHDSPFKSNLFEGGRGAQAFSPLYDQKLIEHMSRGAGNNLVKAIARKLEAGAASRKQEAGAAYRKQQGQAEPQARAVEPVPAATGAVGAGSRPPSARSAAAAVGRSSHSRT